MKFSLKRRQEWQLKSLKHGVRCVSISGGSRISQSGARTLDGVPKLLP